ncbi:MAG: sensor histidine kinase [Phycisphaerales bacterium]
MSRFLAGMQIRKKLVFLHTCFSLVLAGVLALALRPAVRQVVTEAEAHEAGVVVDLVLAEHRMTGEAGKGELEGLAQTIRRIAAQLGAAARIELGTAEELGLSARDTEAALGLANIGSTRTTTAGRSHWAGAVAVVRGGGGGSAADGASGRVEPVFIAASVELAGARAAVVRLYVLTTLALLAVYALVAIALEVFVLPQHVYAPIRTLLDADRALQEGRESEEIIPDSSMPADEIGEIMRSRNESVRALRRHESDLAAALARLEEVAADLRRKNHLLEMARKNLADADRLASLGMMSAGLAHELNTPLAVLKGLVEKLHESQRRNSASAGVEESALMLRVVGRLERLSESLLDFARVRPHGALSVALKPLVDEAWTLVRLDRDAKRVKFGLDMAEDLTAFCDPDRIVQVLVNLLRNAVDALDTPSSGLREPDPEVRVVGARLVRDGKAWASVTITDNGRGIAPDTLERLFQPFVSTRLDAQGTGLGLAVAYGIVREHGGLITARNRGDGVTGAVFEVLLPGAEGETGGQASASFSEPRLLDDGSGAL